MKLLDSIRIEQSGVNRSIKLFVGDLSAIPPTEAVDLLIVSASPNNYEPSWSSLIGALDRRGISVEALSKKKAVDLRHRWASGSYRRLARLCARCAAWAGIDMMLP
jgi:hypothetical protein